MGSSSVLMSSAFQEFVLATFEARMLAPIRVVVPFGSHVVLLVIFLNNSLPAVLSFMYPLAIVKIRWTPPLTRRRTHFFLSTFTLLTAFLIGFFSLGAALAAGWVHGGRAEVFSLLSGALVHGPLEFSLVLLCVAEPLRIAPRVDDQLAQLVRQLRADSRLLPVSLLGLLLSAGIEVFARI